MHRACLIVLAFLVLTIVAGGCGGKPCPPQKPCPETPPRSAGAADPPPWPQRIKPLKFPDGIRIIRVPNALTSVNLRACPEKKQEPDTSQPGVGGYACWTVYPIDLVVENGKVKVVATQDGAEVDATRVKVRPGDCVRWKVIDGANPTNTNVGIKGINFFDTSQEFTNAGKTQPADARYFPIGPTLCTFNRRYCYYQVDLDDGVYSYQAEVSITAPAGTSTYMTDPEVEVACTGTGCGDPDDLEQATPPS